MPFVFENIDDGVRTVKMYFPGDSINFPVYDRKSKKRETAFIYCDPDDISTEVFILPRMESTDSTKLTTEELLEACDPDLREISLLNEDPWRKTTESAPGKALKLMLIHHTLMVPGISGKF